MPAVQADLAVYTMATITNTYQDLRATEINVYDQIFHLQYWFINCLKCVWRGGAKGREFNEQSRACRHNLQPSQASCSHMYTVLLHTI